MKTRVKTGILLFAAVILVMGFSHIPMVMNAAAAFLSFVAADELLGAANMRSRNGLQGACFAIALLVSFVEIPYFEMLAAVMFPAAIVFFALLMTKIGTDYEIKPWHVVLISVITSVFFSSAKYIRFREFGLWELVMAIVVCMVTDSCAYLIGCPLGRHKLAPKVSPAKSIEGALGGSIGGVLVMLLINVIISAAGGPDVHFGKMTVYLLIASVVGQWGDLSMSAFKRIVGIKDYGNLLPGHGGILDRFDSQLFCLPFTYLFCFFCGNLYC